MSKMKQPHTDYGKHGETGEKLPKKSTSSDHSGEKHVGVSKVDKEKYRPGRSGEKVPHAKSRDSSGEKHGRMTGGVAIGKEDDCGREHVGKHDGHHGEYNDGKHERDAYSHKRGR